MKSGVPKSAQLTLHNLKTRLTVAIPPKNCKAARSAAQRRAEQYRRRSHLVLRWAVADRVDRSLQGDQVRILLWELGVGHSGLPLIPLHRPANRRGPALQSFAVTGLQFCFILSSVSHAKSLINEILFIVALFFVACRDEETLILTCQLLHPFLRDPSKGRGLCVQ